MKRTLVVFLLVNLILSACAPASAPTSTPAPSATPLPTATPAPTSTATPTPIPTILTSTTTTCGENPPSGAQLYLKNPGFEETIADKDHTLDPADWLVTEGKTTKGTHSVVEEMPELVQAVGAERQIRPCDGNKMLKIDARLTLKSSVIQYYPEPTSAGRLIQELAVHPIPGEEYAQQIEIRGERDFKGVEGLEMFHLRWTDEGLLLRVRTGSPDFQGQSGFYRVFPPLPNDRWSFIRITLEKTIPTRDQEGRTVSQWKLRVKVNGQTLFDSDREQVYAQYIQSAEFVFIGDETMSGETHKLKPSNTGDGFGVVYYDAVRAWR
jgi:hypothetical protein